MKGLINMENKHLETEVLKELIRRVMTGIDPQCKDDQDVLCDILPSFHAYVDTVVKYETNTIGLLLEIADNTDLL